MTTQLQQQQSLVTNTESSIISTQTINVTQQSQLQDLTLMSQDDLGNNISEQLSVLHHHSSLRENSNRSLMRALVEIGNIDDNSKEQAGVRAMQEYHNFTRRVNYDVKKETYVDDMRKERESLEQYKKELNQERLGIKRNQNLKFGYFTYLLMIVGFCCYFRGTLDSHYDHHDQHNDSWLGLSGLEARITDWLLFQTR